MILDRKTDETEEKDKTEEERERIGNDQTQPNQTKQSTHCFQSFHLAVPYPACALPNVCLVPLYIF